MARIGLVLGAGGIAGHAFHAGTLKALHEATGWDARDAELIVGTSAGSHVGALLRAGLSPADVAARYVGAGGSPDGTQLRRRAGDAEAVPTPRLRVAGMAAPRLVLRAVRHPLQVRPAAVAAAALPPGRVSLRPFAARVRWAFDDHWPTEPLWLPALRLTDGARVVFGRGDAPDTDVGTAVAASCAVPAWFTPVEVGGTAYIDGGVHSPTNADLLEGLGLDLVVVSSPMSVSRSNRRPAADLLARVAMGRRLASEVAGLERGGTEVLVLQPTAADLGAMGLNAMNPHRRRIVLEQAYRTAVGRFQREAWRQRLSPLLT